MKKQLLMSLAGTASLLAGTAVVLQAQFPRAVIDPAAATRGAKLYGSDCARCHGEDARGVPPAPDLIRSEAVLHDRREALHGKELGPLLRTLPDHNFKYEDKQLNDLSQFLSQSINKILRSGYNDQPTNLLSGDAKAGEAYFNGAGGCSKCHSATGDLAGVAKRYTTAALQQKLLFPGSGFGAKLRPQATITQAGGKVTSGEIVRIDDFNVTVRTPDGASHTFSRTPGVKVTTTNPYAAHEALLEKYTDPDIHNLTAYLDTLK